MSDDDTPGKRLLRHIENMPECDWIVDFTNTVDSDSEQWPAAKRVGPDAEFGPSTLAWPSPDGPWTWDNPTSGHP